MSTTEKPKIDASKRPQKRIIPRASKGQSFKDALEATNKQYAGTFAKLAK